MSPRNNLDLIVGLLAATIIGGFLMATEVSAQQSQLVQQIQAPDCAIPGSCIMSPPVINSINKNRGKPTFSGEFDAAYTSKLSVTFAGRTYMLGIDGELTVNGNTWTLDLSGLTDSFDAGTYILVVSAEGFNGTIRQASVSVTFDPVKIEDPSVSDNGGWLANTGQSFLIIVTMAAGLIFIAALFLKNSKKDKHNINK